METRKREETRAHKLVGKSIKDPPLTRLQRCVGLLLLPDQTD